MSSRSSHLQDDEISLVDIWLFMSRQRLVIATCTVLALLVGVAVILFGPKTYQVEVNIDQPRPDDLALLNLALSPAVLTGLEPVSPNQAFDYAARHFRREKSMQRLYAEAWLPLLENPSGQSWNEGQYRGLKSSVQVTRPDEKRNNSDYTLRVSADAPTKAVTLAKAYLQIVEEESRADLLSGLENSRQIRLEEVTRQIQLDRSLYERNASDRLVQLEETLSTARKSGTLAVSDRLVQLKEALTIAQSSGIVDPVVLHQRLPSQDRLKQSADNEALYTLGVKNLQAEISEIEQRNDQDAFLNLRATQAEMEALIQRKDPEPFIPNLRLNQAKKEALEKIDLAQIPVTTFHLDREMQEPQYGTPRKSTVLAVSAFLGLGLGLALAIGRAFLDHVRSARSLDLDLFSLADQGNGAAPQRRSTSPLTTAR